MTMKDTFLRIKELDGKESQALRGEYKEWIEASEDGTKYSHALYESDESKSKHDH